jgi:hypothetical protein
MAAKNDNSCVGYLNDAIKQVVTALTTKGEKRKEAGITAILYFGGFLVCTALTQKKAPQSSCSCSSN